MRKSRYSRPFASQTRHPDARDIRAGTFDPAPAPKSASGRLLPVDVNPGTCGESLTVFHHLDGQGPEQFRFPLVQRRAMRDLPHRAHYSFGIPGLEKVDRVERPLGVREESLE